MLNSITDTITILGFIKTAENVKDRICERGITTSGCPLGQINIAAAAPQISSFRRHKLFPAVLQQPSDVFEIVISH